MKKSLARLLRDRQGLPPAHSKNVLMDVIRLKDGRFARVRAGQLYTVDGTRRLTRAQTPC